MKLSGFITTKLSCCTARYTKCVPGPSIWVLAGLQPNVMIHPLTSIPENAYISENSVAVVVVVAVAVAVVVAAAAAAASAAAAAVAVVVDI